MEEGDCADRVGDVSSSATMVAQDAPVLEPCDRVFDTCALTTMASPRGVAHDNSAPKRRRAELVHTTVATIRQHSAMSSAERLDDSASVVHRIVTIARAAGARGDNRQVTSPYEHLCVTGPAVVLRSSRVCVVTRWNQCAIDNPRPSSIRLRGHGKHSELRRHRRDDAMHARFRDAKHGGELAKRQVGAQCSAGDQHAMSDRARPRAAAAPGHPEPRDHIAEPAPIEGGKHVHAADRHCQKHDVGSIRGVVRNADTRSEQAPAVVA